MRIIIAPNAFKNSLSAAEVADALAQGLAGSLPDAELVRFPLADGGDGTAQLIIARFRGINRYETVQDPLGQPVQSSYGLIDNGNTAVIEMADASGLRLVNTESPAPFRSSTYGTGELILAALNRGVRRIIMGVGGSATVDGGAGILSALGAKFLDSSGKMLDPVPEQLELLDIIDVSGIDPRVFSCEIVVLCDVDNYLLGAEGSAAVFGPQKGVKAAEISRFDAILARISDAGYAATGKRMDVIPHGGAAGGVAAALQVFCNATLAPGADYFLDLTQFDSALADTNLLITAEGSIDEQTLNGKAPFAVARRAKQLGIPVIGVAGSVPEIMPAGLSRYFDTLVPVGNKPMDIAAAIGLSAENLFRTGAMIGKLIRLSSVN